MISATAASCDAVIGDLAADRGQHPADRRWRVRLLAAAARLAGQPGRPRLPSCLDTLFRVETRRPLLLTLVLAVSLPAGSAGTVGSASGGHHVAAKVFCAFSAYALYRDVRAHRLGWAAFQAILAHHNCKQAFRRL